MYSVDFIYPTLNKNFLPWIGEVNPDHVVSWKNTILILGNQDLEIYIGLKFRFREAQRVTTR